MAISEARIEKKTTDRQYCVVKLFRGTKISKTIKTYDDAILNMYLFLRLFLTICCPPLYLHEKESKKKSKSTTVILFHINKIK